jgi:hypothetical protein
MNNFIIPFEISEAKKLPQDNPTIVVPFREQLEQKRGEQLKKFCSHMKRWHPDWPVLIIEQSEDEKKINIGALKNIGAKYAQKMGVKYVVFHDVDLIPLSPIIPFFTAFPEKPIHIGGIYKEKYHNHDNFLGQALSISLKDLKIVNGYPNMSWGWGGDDDVIRKRIKKNGFKVWRPTMDTGYKAIEHVDSKKIPEVVNTNRWEDYYTDTGKHGFNDVKWKVLAEEKDKNVIKYTVLIV